MRLRLRSEFLSVNQGTSKMEEPLFMAVLFKPPANAACAVPQMIKFFGSHRETRKAPRILRLRVSLCLSERQGRAQSFAVGKIEGP